MKIYFRLLSFIYSSSSIRREIKLKVVLLWAELKVLEEMADQDKMEELEFEIIRRSEREMKLRDTRYAVRSETDKSMAAVLWKG